MFFPQYERAKSRCIYTSDMPTHTHPRASQRSACQPETRWDTPTPDREIQVPKKRSSARGSGGRGAGRECHTTAPH